MKYFHKNKFSIFLMCSSMLLLSTLLLSQERKNFSDTNFKIGDIVKVPNLELELLNFEKQYDNDSLNLLIDFLNKNPHLVLEIACYTDSRGNIYGNLQSSQYRADGIKNYLINQKQVVASRISSKGYGETKPLISDETIFKAKSKKEKEKLYLMNRRIELIVKEIK